MNNEEKNQFNEAENEIAEAEQEITKIEQSIESVESEIIEETDDEESSQSEEKTGVLSEPAEGHVLDESELTYDSPYLQAFDAHRLKFLKMYKWQNTFKWIISVIGLGLVIFAWLGNYLWSYEIWVTILIICAGLAIFAGYYTFIHFALKKRTKAYFAAYYNNTVRYVMDDDRFHNLVVHPEEKIEPIQFLETGIYHNIVQVGSRAVVDFDYKGIQVMVCDAAGSVKYEKRLMPVFVGKFISTTSNYDSPDRLIVYIKGDKRAIPPTDVDDLKVIHDDTEYAVYSNNENYAKTLTPKLKKMIRQFKPNNDLVDVSVCLKDKRAYFLLGYDDSLMVLPLEHRLLVAPLDQYKHDLDIALQIIEEVNK